MSKTEKLLKELNKLKKNLETRKLSAKAVQTAMTNAIEIADSLNQEVLDINAILGTTLTHNSQLENTLNDEKNKAEDDTRKYECIVNASQDVMTLVNRKLEVGEINVAFTKNYKKERSQVIGQKYRSFWGDYLYKKHLASAIASGFEGNAKTLTLEVGSDKENRKHLELSISPYQNEKGEVTHIAIIERDVTEAKGLQDQVIRSQRMESIGTLAGGISHDLNNILSPFFMVIKILEQKLAHDEDGLRILELLNTSAKRGAELVKQILSFTKGSQGEQVNLQVRFLMQEMVDLIKETFPKEIALKSSIPKDLWLTVGDATELHQVLLNLCVNARDAILPNQGQISLTGENVQLTGKKGRRGPYVLMRIEDTGIGIKEEDQGKIFEPFFTTKSFGKGTGIGLSTVLTVIENHEGFIDVTSEPGKGTCFEIYLPAITESVATITPIPKETIFSGDGQTVLLVEDDIQNREMSKTTLEAFGYKVITAQNGEEGVEKYNESKAKIDIIIMDMMMPVMDGPTAINEIRTKNKDAKIIGMTGFILEDNGLKKAKVQKQVNSFLYKPFSSDTLLKTMDTILKAH